ncbi:MAG: glutamate 5-kinase [Armatimonadetes bacterium]|nr:glutamate 5-kinase [Armatimonadota bacterium]
MLLPRCLVVKIGSSTLLGPDGRIDRAFISDLARQVAEVQREGGQPVIVSSGAVAAGMERLGMNRRPRTIPEKQACAAIGQGELMGIYADRFAEHGLVIGQMLLTRDDFHARTRYLNARNTLFELLKQGAVPIINENDTIAVEEIKIGDNDTLSALVAAAVNAGKLLILSNVDGLMDRTGQVIPMIPAFTPEIEALAEGSGDRYGTGGMRTKLEAARIATHSGVEVLIAKGRRPDVIPDAWRNERIGTRFPSQTRLSSWKHWIAFGLSPRGVLTVNERAVDPLIRQGKSLLPIGIVDVNGSFEAGDLVEVQGPSGEALARGLSNYSALDVARIQGHHTREIEERLGRKDFDEVIHRDNMWIAPRTEAIPSVMEDGSTLAPPG